MPPTQAEMPHLAEQAAVEKVHVCSAHLYHTSARPAGVRRRV